MELIKQNKSLINVLKSTTVRDFKGGWNVVDEDINLSSKYSTLLDNWVVGIDGSHSVRYGTRMEADLAENAIYADEEIVKGIYFQDRHVVIMSNGHILSVTDTGVATVIFNPTLAAALPGSPSGWGATDFASFAVIKGKLYVQNGVDKMLVIDHTVSPVCQYSVDPPTGSNVNTPIGRYLLALGDYLIVAGIPTAPGSISISARGAPQTFLSDPAPNDATVVDVSQKVQTNSNTIRGIGQFRGKLVVMFDDVIALGDVGVYESTSHVPTFKDNIESIGSIAHHSYQNLGNDAFMSDTFGVPSLGQALFTGSVRPDRVSQLIDPEVHKALLRLSIGTSEDYIHSVYNKSEALYMLGVPNGDADEYTEVPYFVFKNISKLKINAWSRFRGWKFRDAWRSALGRVFFARGPRIFVYGSKDDPIHADYVDFMEAFTDDTYYVDNTGNSPTDQIDSGVPIQFDWELPWADFDDRVSVKNTRYIAFDTTGTGEFTVSMYTDNRRRKVTGEDDPAVSMSFRAGDFGGFGESEFGFVMGGGRSAQDERLYDWPAQFKIAKLRFHGSSKEPISVVSFSLMYLKGGIRR